MSRKLKKSVAQYKDSFAFNTAINEFYSDKAGEEKHAESAVAARQRAAGALRDVSLPPLFKSVENSEKDKALKKLRDVQINNCIKCGLAKKRNLIVFGEGSSDSDLMFIGEAPGAEEDETGRPFVGRAGQLLTKIIESINLKREYVYIANIIKCRPPGNRNPEQSEIESCSSFLREQIDIIKPKIICTLGKFSSMFIFNEISNSVDGESIEFEKMGVHRGKIYNYKSIKVVPTYHPSYLLRNPSAKKDVWEDMKLIRSMLS
jgi:DNA polymerase